jgi:branched-chain amino acid transport system ATP-binding protein
MKPLLELRRVSAAYGQIEALHDVSLEVRPGAIVALLGANGAGKSTTLKVVSCLMPATQGSVVFDGQAIERWKAHQAVAAGISQVPEGREVFKDMTVDENLRLGAYVRGAARDVDQDKERALAYFPVLKQRLKQKAGSMSGGEQQMLLIARALMARPRLLLLDEPSLGLSPLLVEQIFEIIRKINRDGMTVLLVEQSVAIALSCSSFAYILENGEIVHHGDSQSLAANSRIRETYLGT